MMPTRIEIPNRLFAAEMTMTFLQLAYDEWEAFGREECVKGKALWERKSVTGSICAINRQIKNKMINAGGSSGEEAFGELMDAMADNADSVSEELDAVHSVIKGKVLQKMPWNFQMALAYSACTYSFLYYANEMQKMMNADNRDNPNIKSALDVVNNIYKQVKFEIWEDIGNLDCANLFSPIIEKLMGSVYEKHNSEGAMRQRAAAPKIKAKPCIHSGLDRIAAANGLQKKQHIVKKFTQ